MDGDAGVLHSVAICDVDDVSIPVPCQPHHCCGVIDAKVQAGYAGPVGWDGKSCHLDGFFCDWENPATAQDGYALGPSFSLVFWV